MERGEKDFHGSERHLAHSIDRLADAINAFSHFKAVEQMLLQQTHLLNEINERQKQMAMTQQELTDGLKKIQSTVGKVAAEQSKRFDDLSKEIKDLKDLIAAGGTITPEIEQAVVDTQAALDALDNTIPDAPV